MAILKVVINVTIIFRILFNFSSPEVATAYMLSMRAQVTRYLMLWQNIKEIKEINYITGVHFPRKLTYKILLTQ